MFKALGCLTDKDIIEYVICHSRNETLRHRLAQLLLPTLLQTTDIHTEPIFALDKIWSYLQNYSQSFNVDMKIRYCKTIIQRICNLHLGDDIKKKHISWMDGLQDAIVQIRISKPTDRDNYQNKRMETTGSLMGRSHKSMCQPNV